MAKWCDQGESDILGIYLRNASQNPYLYLGLFMNSSEPAENATLAGLTEPSGGGYDRIQLDPNDWLVSGSMPTAAENVEKTFSCSSDWGLIYGYFIATAQAGTMGKLVCVENFPNGPYTIISGGVVKLTPKLTC